MEARTVRNRRNPLTASAAGGRALSAMQLPLFAIRPPRGYAVLTTIGRTTAKPRRRCIRAIRDGDRVYLVAIKGAAKTGWAKNALRGSEVRLRLPDGRHRGVAREPLDAAEAGRARDAYCSAVHRFDYLTWLNWKPGRPTRDGISRMLGEWFERGTPVVVELGPSRRPAG